MSAEKAKAYWQLMRMDRPIGSLLLMWPTIWALIISAQGMPSWDVFIVFVLGVFLMRSAGCVINDFADRKVDGHVKRTKQTSTAIRESDSKRSDWIIFWFWVSARFC